MTPAQLQFHEQHKQRIARINARAYQPPVLEVIAPPEPVIVKTVFQQPANEDFAPRVRDIQNSLAEHFAIPRIDLLSERRDWPTVRYRQLGFLLSKELTPLSTIRIGRYFGGKDHSTVLHGIRKAKELIDHDPDLKNGYEAIRARFGVSHATS